MNLFRSEREQTYEYYYYHCSTDLTCDFAAIENVEAKEVPHSEVIHW